MGTDTASVRVGEELDHAGLIEFLQGKIEGIDHGTEIKQFPAGRSNLTYLLRTDTAEYVLRRAPLGHLAAKAHDMAREYHLLKKLHVHFPLAPKTYLLCEDTSILGAVFYLMERRQGNVIRDELPLAFKGIPDVEAIVSRAFVDCLAGLHSIDVFRTDLVSIGKPEGFLARQVLGWSDRWYGSQTQPHPDMDRVIDWLKGNMPNPGTPTLVHNDFKLDNVMLATQDPCRVVAVLDWEMTTVGDPLVDLGLTLCYWLQRGVPEERRERLFENPGWYSREQILERYAMQTGRDLTNIAWYEVLGIFKLAVIVQQIYFRYVKGQTQDQRFKNFDLRVRALVQAAVDHAG